jgi:hypothetical protein
VELAVRSIERHLPVSAMCCSHDPAHLAVLYCDTCRVHVCRACSDSAHSEHVTHPYRYVDWSEPPPRGLVADLGELIADSAQALQAGLTELLPGAKSKRQGVVFSDKGELASSDGAGPVRKLRRWLHLS